jgi:hypothetical protein
MDIIHYQEDERILEARLVMEHELDTMIRKMIARLYVLAAEVQARINFALDDIGGGGRDGE